MEGDGNVPCSLLAELQGRRQQYSVHNPGAKHSSTLARSTRAKCWAFGGHHVENARTGDLGKKLHAGHNQSRRVHGVHHFQHTVATESTWKQQYPTVQQLPICIRHSTCVYCEEPVSPWSRTGCILMCCQRMPSNNFFCLRVSKNVNS